MPYTKITCESCGGSGKVVKWDIYEKPFSATCLGCYGCGYYVEWKEVELSPEDEEAFFMLRQQKKDGEG